MSVFEELLLTIVDFIIYVFIGFINEVKVSLCKDDICYTSFGIDVYSFG